MLQVQNVLTESSERHSLTDVKTSMKSGLCRGRSSRRSTKCPRIRIVITATGLGKLEGTFGLLARSIIPCISYKSCRVDALKTWRKYY